jgi:nucleotide-binding universal stress UspA family protein
MTVTTDPRRVSDRTAMARHGHTNSPSASLYRPRTTLRAVYVSDWPTGVRADGRLLLVEDLVLVQDGELERAARAPITEIYREIAPEDDWSLEFARGKSGKVLVDLSRHSRLLVIGTGEHVGLGKIMLGSTSHYCLGHASCPVVAVPALDVSPGG